jgi:hypothetical protein
MKTKDRRLNPDDRRKFNEKELSSCREESGEIICEERRQRPDRRINNIHVEWTDDPEVV